MQPQPKAIADAVAHAIESMLVEAREAELCRATPDEVAALLRRRINSLCDRVWEWRYRLSHNPNAFRDAPTSGSGAGPQHFTHEQPRERKR